MKYICNGIIFILFLALSACNAGTNSGIALNNQVQTNQALSNPLKISTDYLYLPIANDNSVALFRNVSGKLVADKNNILSLGATNSLQINSFTTANNYMYVATIKGLYTYSIKQGKRPDLVSKIDENVNFSNIKVSLDGTLLFAVNNNGLSIYNIKNTPQSPTLKEVYTDKYISKLDDSNTYLNFSADGQYLYFSKNMKFAADNGIIIYKINAGALEFVNAVVNNDPNLANAAINMVSQSVDQQKIYLQVVNEDNQGNTTQYILVYAIQSDDTVVLIQKQVDKYVGVEWMEVSSDNKYMYLCYDKNYIEIATLNPDGTIKQLNTQLFSYIVKQVSPITSTSAVVAAFDIDSKNHNAVKTMSIDPASGNLSEISNVTIPSTMSVANMLFFPNRSKLYFTGLYAPEIYKFSIDQNMVLSPDYTDTGDFPRKIIQTPDLKFLFVLNENSHNISSYAVNNRGALNKIATTPINTALSIDTTLDMTISPNGKYLVSGGNGYISIFSVTATGMLNLIKTIPVKGTLFNVSISPESKNIFFTVVEGDFTLNELSFSQLKNYRPDDIKVIKNSYAPLGEVKFSLDGKFAYLASEQQIFMYNYTQSTLVPLAPAVINSNVAISNISFSNIGSTMYVSSINSNSISYYDIQQNGELKAGKTLTNISSPLNIFPNWDNSSLYISSLNDGDIYVVPLNSNGSFMKSYSNQYIYVGNLLQFGLFSHN